MTSHHADKYDSDGWYRATITELIKVVREQDALDIRSAVEDQIIDLRRNYDDEEELWGMTRRHSSACHSGDRLVI